MNIKSKHFAKYYNLFAGLLDSLTGFLLVCSPVFVLSMLGINEPSNSLVFIRYIGVFVFSTGASYFISFAEKYLNTQGLILSIVIWHITCLTRILVALFIVTQVLWGELSTPWLLVGASDLSIALFQIYLIQINRVFLNAK